MCLSFLKELEWIIRSLSLSKEVRLDSSLYSLYNLPLVLLGLADKITKIYGFCNVCGLEATKTYRKIEGGDRTKVGAADIYEPRCLKHL